MELKNRNCMDRNRTKNGFFEKVNELMSLVSLYFFN